MSVFDLDAYLVRIGFTGQRAATLETLRELHRKHIVARAAEGRRYALHNNVFAEHTLGGDTERRLITDAFELRELLSSTFQIRLPRSPTLAPLLERLVRLAARPLAPGLSAYPSR